MPPAQVVDAKYAPITGKWSAPLVEMLKACLSRDPEDRPASAELVARPYFHHLAEGTLHSKALRHRQAELFETPTSVLDAGPFTEVPLGTAPTDATADRAPTKSEGGARCAAEEAAEPKVVAAEPKVKAAAPVAGKLKPAAARNAGVPRRKPSATPKPVDNAPKKAAVRAEQPVTSPDSSPSTSPTGTTRAEPEVLEPEVLLAKPTPQEHSDTPRKPRPQSPVPLEQVARVPLPPPPPPTAPRVRPISTKGPTSTSTWSASVRAGIMAHVSRCIPAHPVS